MICDDIPAGVELFTGNFSGGAPYTLTGGTRADASGITCNFVSLASNTDCVTFYGVFSNPITPSGSYNPSVKSIEFRPAGAMNPSDDPSTPDFDIDFRIHGSSP